MINRRWNAVLVLLVQQSESIQWFIASIVSTQVRLPKKRTFVHVRPRTKDEQMQQIKLRKEMRMLEKLRRGGAYWAQEFADAAARAMRPNQQRYKRVAAEAAAAAKSSNHSAAHFAAARTVEGPGLP